MFVQKRDYALSQARAELGKMEQAITQLQEERRVQQAAVDEAETEAVAAHGELKQVTANCGAQMLLERGRLRKALPSPGKSTLPSQRRIASTSMRSPDCIWGGTCKLRTCLVPRT